MFGFLKRKKKDDASDSSQPAAEAVNEADASDESSDGSPAEKTGKKKSKKKLIIFVVLILIAVGAAGGVVYFLYLAPKGDGEAKRVPYKKVVLTHVALPDEMLEFSYTYYPNLYQAMLDYEYEINLIDTEISRINAIGQQYPEQIKIADKEKKVWEKTRSGLEKAFLKILKPVKESYVLFRVNQTQGETRINETRADLTASATEALTQARIQTDQLKSKDNVPEGFIQGTLYKLKKKFL